MRFYRQSIAKNSGILYTENIKTIGSDVFMYEIDNQKFGRFVAALRKEKGYTQKELAEKLFLSDKAISKWERGLSLR